MISEKIFDFLSALAANNNREWFHDNKPSYIEARQEFEHFVANFIGMIGQIDPSIGKPTAKESIFRLNRDIRFSNDKRPYKQNFGCYVAQGGRKSILPGYYIQFEPGASFFGGGIYCPQADILKKVRSEIAVFPEDLSAILERPSFKQTFGDLWPDRLKSAPKGFPKDHEAIELLKYKSYTATCNFTDEQCLADGFENTLKAAIGNLRPLNDFLLRAIEAPEEEKIEF